MDSNHQNSIKKSIEVNFPDGKRVDAKIGDMVIKTDQSVTNGGEGSAPEPFQLFLASLATCAGIYALSFCQARKLSTKGMALKMICHVDQKIKQHKKMIFELKLPDGFPEKHEDAIIRSMNLCTVKKHIINAPEFEIKVI